MLRTDSRKARFYIWCLLALITGIVFATLLPLPSSVFAEGLTPVDYNTYSVDNCGLTLAYPSSWLAEAKTGRLDIEHMGEVSVMDATNINPYFLVFSCDGVYQCDEAQPTKCLTLEKAATLLRDMIINDYDPEFNTSLIEDVHIESSLIDGQDTAVFATVEKYTDSTIPDLGSEIYLTEHNGVIYGFSYFDFATDFDSPTSKGIRDKILHSISFFK